MRRELSEAGSSLVRAGVAPSFDIADADGVELVVIRATDGRTGRVTMTGTTEARDGLRGFVGRALGYQKSIVRPAAS